MALTVLVILGTDAIHAHIPPTTRADRGEAFVPSPEIAKLASLGFDAAVGDYFWLQAIQAIGGDVLISDELGRHLARLIDVVTSLDPHVDHPYRFAAVWLTESEENVRDANRLLLRGIAAHPEEWRNYFYLGFNYFFYLMENENAADALESATRLPGSPRYLPRLVARLRSETADIDVAEVFLRELTRNTTDEHKQAEYQSALDEIEMEKKARFLDRARRAFIELNGRDIMNVEELVSGPHPMLSQLPNPEPESMPASLSRDSVWELDFEKDQIQSSFYGSRYRVHFNSRDHERAKLWKQDKHRAAEEQGDADPQDGSVGVKHDS